MQKRVYLRATEQSGKGDYMALKTVTWEEASKHLEKLASLIDAGNEVEILRQGKPSPKVVSQPRKPRKLDLHKGAITMSDDFDAPLDDDFWLGSNP